MRHIKYNIQDMAINESRVFTGGWDSIRTCIRRRQKKLNKQFSLKPYNQSQVIVNRIK